MKYVFADQSFIDAVSLECLTAYGTTWFELVIIGRWVNEQVRIFPQFFGLIRN